MANRYMDGFEDYQTADVNKYWTNASYMGIETGGRTGSAFHTDTGGYVNRTFDAQTTWTIGCAYKVPTVIVASSLIALYDDSTNQVDLYLNANGKISVRRNTTVLATSTNSINGNTYYYFEITATIDNAGSYQVWVNDVSWIDDGAGGPKSGDTQNTANASANVVSLTVPAASYLDDLYINDATGGVDDGRWGDVTILSKFPNGNGATNNFTGQDADSTDNYLNVDEAATDFPDEATYNESGTIGHIDLYAMQDLTGYTDGTHSVMGVQVCVVAKKTDTGVKTMCTEVRQDSTNYDGSAFAPSATSYAGFHTQYGNAPDATAWTVVKFNALQVGAKIVS